MKLLAFDPGGTTGFAEMQRRSGVSLSEWEKLQVGYRTDCKDNPDQIVELLMYKKPDIIVCEQFRLYPWKAKAQAWSQLTESQIIGAVKCYAKIYNVPCYMQTTGERDMGYMYGSVPHLPKSNPANHAHDAWAHACNWVINTHKGTLI